VLLLRVRIRIGGIGMRAATHEGGKNHRKFRLFLAFPLPLFLMLVDMLEDAAILFTPFVNSKNAGKRIKAFWSAVMVLKGIAREVCFNTGPLDLVDVDASGKDEKVRVSIVTR